MFLSRPFFCLIHKQTFDKLRAIIAEGRHESKHVERIKFSRFYHKLVAHETLRKIIAFCNNNASQNHLCVKPTCGYFPLDLHHLISFVIRLNEHSLNHPQNSHFSVSTTTESESKKKLSTRHFGNTERETRLKKILPHVEMFIVSSQLPFMINQNFDPERSYACQCDLILMELEIYFCDDTKMKFPKSLSNYSYWRFSMIGTMLIPKNPY